MAGSASSERGTAARSLSGAVGAVRREEWFFASAMFTYVFLVIGTFWILKPVKKALFLRFYDRRGFAMLGWRLDAAEAELLAKVLNMVVAAAAVAVFTWLARRVRRERLTAVLMAGFIAADLAYAGALGRPGAGTVWTFYLYGDLFSTLMVATFFASLNDSVTPDAAKRLYGFIGLGAVLGGAVGSSVLGVFVDDLAPATWMLVCAAAGVVIVAVAYGAGRAAPHPGERADDATAPTRNAALEGAALVMRSRYLQSIAVIVALYEIVSTVMDFQFTSAVASRLDGHAIEIHLSRVFAVTNVLAMLVQFFITPAVMQAWPLGVALLVLPATTAAGSLAFLVAPSLWTGSALNAADNAFSYSTNQSAKEALYVPTTGEEKYKAKAFIDMFVQRAAKTTAVMLSLAMSLGLRSGVSTRWLSLVTLALIVVWVAAVRYAGSGDPAGGRPMAQGNRESTEGGLNSTP